MVPNWLFSLIMIMVKTTALGRTMLNISHTLSHTLSHLISQHYKHHLFLIRWWNAKYFSNLPMSEYSMELEFNPRQGAESTILALFMQQIFECWTYMHTLTKHHIKSFSLVMWMNSKLWELFPEFSTLYK